MAEGTAFTFMLSGKDASGNPAPMPKDAEGNDVTEVTLHESDFQNGTASFGFGTITYAQPGTYTIRWPRRMVAQSLVASATTVMKRPSW